MILELAALSRLSGIPIFEVKICCNLKLIKTVVKVYNVVDSIIFFPGKSS